LYAGLVFPAKTVVHQFRQWCYADAPVTRATVSRKLRMRRTKRTRDCSSIPCPWEAVTVRVILRRICMAKTRHCPYPRERARLPLAAGPGEGTPGLAISRRVSSFESKTGCRRLWRHSPHVAELVLLVCCLAECLPRSRQGCTAHMFTTSSCRAHAD
jgi:hypothetical protein